MLMLFNFIIVSQEFFSCSSLFYPCHSPDHFRLSNEMDPIKMQLIPHHSFASNPPWICQFTQSKGLTLNYVNWPHFLSDLIPITLLLCPFPSFAAFQMHCSFNLSGLLCISGPPCLLQLECFSLDLFFVASSLSLVLGSNIFSQWNLPWSPYLKLQACSVLIENVLNL